MNPYDLIFHFYPIDTPLRRLLILHSEKVRDKALEILEHARQIDEPRYSCVDDSLIIAGSLLHDIGIGKTHAPSILCDGEEHYICHGTLGAEMLRELPSSFVEPALKECLARICERHTGAGLSRQDIVDQQLPISPARDLLPETLEEQLICLADKFYSKSGDPTREKSLEHIRRSMMKFGTDSQKRFEALCQSFFIK